MSFSPPVFNTPAGLWFAPRMPILGPPDFTTNIQMYVNPKIVVSPIDMVSKLFYVEQFIRMSKADYLAIGGMVVGSIWGLQDSTGATWDYRVMWWDTAHLNFPNEYLEMLVAQCDGSGNVPDPFR